MASPIELSWTQPGLASNLIRHLRAVNRVTRTEIDGHTFAYPDLADAWVSEDGAHILLTHHADTTWHHWRHTPDGGWRFTGVYATEEQAESAVLAMVRAAIEAKPEPGTYVSAQLRPDTQVIRVRCRSQDGPAVLSGIFTRLGYTTTIDEVA